VLSVKRKPTTSLANYDIELLKVWYGVLRDASGKSCVCPEEARDVDNSEGPEPPPQLVIFLHEFEQFDEAVIQDLFCICR
jgi:origin recognition complex subunit 3